MYSSRHVLIASIVCAASASTVAAGPLSKPANAEARAHLEKAIRLYNTREFEAAIAELKAGALLEAAPVFDYNLGQSNRQLGRYEDALWHYQRFLSAGQPTGELLDAVNGFIGEMKAHLEDKARTMPPNGPGGAGEPSEPSGKALPTSTSTTATTAATGQSDTAKIDEAHGPNWLGWGLTVGGVTAMGVGAGFLVSASHLFDKANSTLDFNERQSLGDSASTRWTVGAIVGVVGIGLTIGGVIDLLVTHSHHDSQKTASIDIGVGSNQLFVFGRF